MVAFYVMKIKDGTITIEDVPGLWRKKVEEELGAQVKKCMEIRATCQEGILQQWSRRQAWKH